MDRILLFLTIILAAIIPNSCAFKQEESSASSDNQYPYIVQYIPEFKLEDKDIITLLMNQFKTISISNVKTAYVSIDMQKITPSYLGNKKKSQYLSPLKVRVTQDSFKMGFQFTAKVTHIVGSKTYNCQTSLPEVLFNYTKEVNFESGNTLIADYHTSYSSLSFQKPTCKESQSTKDQARLDESINATEGSSLYLQLKKIITKIPDYMNINAKSEHLSKIYDTNPYAYDYYGYTIKIDVGTINVVPLGQKGIENQIKGIVGNSLIPSIPPPTYIPVYTSFYSLEFIKNLILQSKQTNPKWKGIQLNRSNMRTRLFKWRLVDFQNLIPTILAKYPALYLHQVTIVCSILEVGQSKLTQQVLIQKMRWDCEGSLQTQPNKKETFLNFKTELRYEISIEVNNNYLTVLNNNVVLTNVQFNYIGQHEVVDPYLASQMIKQSLFEFRVYTIGTFFKVLSPNKQLALTEAGIWIK